MIFTLSAVLTSFVSPAMTAEPRSLIARDEFKREHPCPATGQRRGPCPGYVVDHIIPLCAGGPDHRSNMQWQTIEDGKRKDATERLMCKIKFGSSM